MAIVVLQHQDQEADISRAVPAEQLQQPTPHHALPLFSLF